MSSSWGKLEIEEIIQSALIRDLDESRAEVRYGCYTLARQHLLDNILDEIKRVQPDMTDHGPKHVKNVLENIQDLLGDSIGSWNRSNKTLSEGLLNGMELYILGLSALFHDVGNVFERKEHQKQIGPIYDFARPSDGGNQASEEKQVIMEICKAHCGDGLDGSKNTLAFVRDRAKLDRKEIRPNLLAPILRFADELAEGEQRTSHFLLHQCKYPEENIKYHQYALSSSVDIDRAHGRIRLNYHITLRLPNESESNGYQHHGPVISIEDLPEFLKGIYHRIEKVNQERQYAKHYCSILEPFKETSASFNFWHQGLEIPIDLPAIPFSDLVIPGHPQMSVVQRDDKYNPEDLVVKLSGAIADMNT